MLHRLLLGLVGLCCLAAAAAGAGAPAEAARKVPPPFPDGRPMQHPHLDPPGRPVAQILRSGGPRRRRQCGPIPRRHPCPPVHPGRLPGSVEQGHGVGPGPLRPSHAGGAGDVSDPVGAVFRASHPGGVRLFPPLPAPDRGVPGPVRYAGRGRRGVPGVHGGPRPRRRLRGRRGRPGGHGHSQSAVPGHGGAAAPARFRAGPDPGAGRPAQPHGGQMPGPPAAPQGAGGAPAAGRHRGGVARRMGDFAGPHRAFRPVAETAGCHPDHVHRRAGLAAGGGRPGISRPDLGA